MSSFENSWDYFLDVPEAATGSMFSLWRRKIYLPFASLAFGVVPRSSRGESILQRDVEKRDVDVPRDRENDSGRENERTKKNGESQKRRTKEWATLCVCICRYLHTCVCVCALQKVLAHSI